MNPPIGVVTMLFTDIEGSTKWAQELGDAWPGVLADHRRILRDSITDAGGYIDATEGDSFFATFADADAARTAATNAQRALRHHAWPQPVGELRVRMGLHTGAVEHTDGHYVGIEVHRGARVAAAASGGQVLVSDAALAAMVKDVSEDLGWHRLKDFPDPIRISHLVVDPDRPAATFPPPKTLDVRPTNLPPTDRPLVGRTSELSYVTDEFLEKGARLVTLTGLGGVGKTTLALHAARSLLDTFTGGVWLVQAESLDTRDDLLQAVGAAIRVRDVPGADLLRTLADRFESGRFLLVLDNLEHLTSAPLLIADLLMCAPGLAILATSRAPLRLGSERAITIGPMSSDEAAKMFMSRATVVDPTLSFDDRETRHAVIELCERLGWLPLALELAAARLRLMTPHQLLERLGSALDLRSTEADRPERHRSVRATIEWTLGLLPEEATRLFTRLGVFAGTPSLDVIEMICADGIDVVEAAASLVDYSLLRKSGPGLELVEALREVAVERLDDSAEREVIRRAHAEAMIVLGQGVNSSAWTANAPKATLELMERMLPDTWAAARWARRSDPRVHAALVAKLALWWAWRGALRMTTDEIEFAVSTPDMRPAERGELLINRAHLLLLEGRPSEALRDAEEAMALLGDQSDPDRRDLQVLGWAQTLVGMHTEAVKTGRAALKHHRLTGSRERIVYGLAQLAQSIMQAGDPTEAGSLLDEAELLGEGLEDVAVIGLPSARADWCIMTGDPARGLQGYVDSLTSSRTMGQLSAWDIAGIAIALEQLGEAEVSLEVAAALERATAEWGTPIKTVGFAAGGVRAAMERARDALTPEQAQAAETRGRAVEADERATHTLEIARRVLARLGVR